MPEQNDRFHIGEFAELVGLSVPQLRRYDRLALLAPEGRSEAGYRYYGHAQTGAGRIIALLRSMDMPIADIRKVLSGVSETERTALLADHRSRLEARLVEVQGLLDAVDRFANKEKVMKPTTEPSSWLHFMPHLPVSNVGESVTYYEESLGFRLAWQTTDQSLSALASGPVEMLLLVPWQGDGKLQPHSSYVYVDDPDSLCAEYDQAGANIVRPVASRPNGMRDFVVSDPDGHTFTLGRGEEDGLRAAADHYGLDPDEITADPSWLEGRA